MDVNIKVDATVPNTNEPEINRDQDNGNFGTTPETLFVNDREITTTEEQPSVEVGNVLVVEEAIAVTTTDGIIMNDSVVYQVADNAQDVQDFVTTECTTDGIVTYVTVASSSNQEIVTTGFAERVAYEKETVEVIQETYENVAVENVIEHEGNYESSTQSYEKFVQDAIEGEIEEPVAVITDADEGIIETIVEQNVVEAPESTLEHEQPIENTVSIEDKLGELTGQVEQQDFVADNEKECEENISRDDSNVTVTEVEDHSSTDEHTVSEQSTVSTIEEHVSADFKYEKDQPEQDITEVIEIHDTSPTHDNIEKQLSKIVHDEPHQLSIAEEISRDFDDSDSEQLTVSQEPHDNVIEEVVNIAKQLGHGPLTVTDNTGQIYYVESVEEVIVVENNSKLDSKAEKSEEVIEEERPAPPPIPSHLLGRNIDNPIEDTFRNGKTPPKPRLGVKIPYKNLTSQIVSKDDIAKELIERSKTRLLQNRSSREAYFAKQLTKRLAKKIAPTPRQETKRSKEINNSDLIAILEGKDDDKQIETKSNEKHAYMDKELERELALKQLSELPKRGRRRRDSGYDVIENVNIPPREKRNTAKYEGREDISVPKLDNPKVIVQKSDRNVVEIANTVRENSPVEEEKPVMTNKPVMDIQKTGSEVKTSSEKRKSNIEECCPVVKDTNMEKGPVEKKKITVEKEKIYAELKKADNLKVEEPISKVDISKLKTNEPTVMIETSKKTIHRIEEISKLHQKNPSTSTTTSASKLTDDIELKSNNPPIKTYERKRKSVDENITPIPEKKVITTGSSNAYITKSSRIIKKKVIWDPDDPTTAKYAADKISPQKLIKGITSVKVTVKENRKIELPSTVVKPMQKLEKIVFKPDRNAPKLEKVVSMTKSSTTVQKEVKTKSPETTNKIKKRLSEVDKLLMDEGAVNMLYSVKNEDTKKFTGTTISLDKVEKELMNKTNEIKKDLTNSTDKISPKSLRKKDSAVITPTKRVYPASVIRKKSKDSSRSSIHSPPASPSAMIYANHADASRIIRRHSSSSYSSTDDMSEENKIEKKPPKKRLKKQTPEQPVDKYTTNKDNFSKLEKENKSNNYDFVYSKFQHYKAIKVGQWDNLVQVSLLCEDTTKAYLSYDVLLELTDLLKELQNDDLCKVVVLSSTATSFCHGINYKSLHIEDEQIRKEIAQKLAKAVTQYLKTLANFPKIIIAGIQGECIGLAVTMLPLFDMVLASDTATFSIPNAKLGCAAEGGSLLSLPHLMHNALVSEMLYASRKFVAAEALRFGMVTRVIWPDKFQTELISAVKEISTHSLQFKQITKRQLRNRMKHQIEESLTGEEDVLLDTWISAECQKNFETYG